MKTISKLSLLLEKQTLNLGAGQVEPTKEVPSSIQWPYEYTWTNDDPSQGTTEAFAKFIFAGTEGDAKDLLAQLQKGKSDQAVGIARDAKNIQKSRLFGKDTSTVKGWIYLFKPGTIDTAKIPADKQLADKPKNSAGQDLFAFIVDSEFKNYIKKPDAAPIGSPAGNTTGNAKPVTLLNINAAAADRDPVKVWFDMDGGINTFYLNPTLEKIGQSEVVITQSGEIVPVFKQFAQALPDDLRYIPDPAEAPTTYSEALQSSIKKLFDAAAKWDSQNFPVKTTKLDASVYSKMVKALVIIGINTGKIDVKVPISAASPDSQEWFKAIKAGFKQSGAIQKAQPTLAGAFDGSIIKTEDEILKIFAGSVADSPKNFNNPKPDAYDTIAKVKSLFRTNMGSGKYDNMLAALKAYNGFEKGKTYPKSDGFKDFQYTILGKDDGNFNDALHSKITDVLAKSPIK